MAGAACCAISIRRTCARRCCRNTSACLATGGTMMSCNRFSLSPRRSSSAMNERLGVRRSLNSSIGAGWPFAVLLFVSPFPGATTLRLTCLAAAFIIAVARWRQLAPPPVPCRWAIALWAGVVIASLQFAVDPAYSLGEVRREVLYGLMAFVSFFAWTRDEQRLRLLCLAVLAGFAAISGSALLGSYLRNGDWPSDAYYGGVGAVSNYLV